MNIAQNATSAEESYWQVTFLLGALLVAFCLPANLLITLGIPYTQPGGNFIIKFHPASWLTGLALVSSLMTVSGRIAISNCSSDHPVLFFYLATIFAATTYTFLSFGPSGVAFYVDTLFIPGVYLFLLYSSSRDARQRIFALALGLCTLHALIGLGEYALGSRLIPFLLDGEPYVETYFRSTGLSSHPLEGAGRIVPALFAYWILPNRMTRTVTLILFLSLLAFGSRSALGVSLLLLGLMTTREIWHSLLHHSISPRGILIRAVFLGISIPIVYFAADQGLGQRIFESLYLDSSALSRIDSVQILHDLEPKDLLFGIGAEGVTQVEHARRGWFNIENFWVVLILQMGLPMAALVSLALLSLLYSIYRKAPVPVRYMLVAFIVTASSNNALTVKTQNLLILIALSATSLSVPIRERSDSYPDRWRSAHEAMRRMRRMRQKRTA